MQPAGSRSRECRSALTSLPVPSNGSPATNRLKERDERDLRGAPADRRRHPRVRRPCRPHADGDDGDRRGSFHRNRRRRAPRRDHHGLEERQAEDGTRRQSPGGSRHPLRGTGDERPSRPRAGPRVLPERADARPQGDHRRGGDVGGAAGRGGGPHRPAGDRRADPRQEPRRARRAALGGADAARDPGRLRRHRRCEERRRARRADNQRVIPRYTRSEIGAVWTPQAKFDTWLEVELAATEAWAAEGVVPEEAAREAREKAAFTVEAVDEREKVTDHDVAAFVDVVAASVGEHGRWIHYGLTSSDVLDTALALQLRRAGEAVLASACAYRDALVTRALEHRDTLCVGRTHGVHAEPTTFGLRLAGFAFEADRNLDRLEEAFAQLAVRKLSGAVGTYASVPPAGEARVIQKLGLGREDVATQVVPRDRHAELLA